MTLIRNGTTFAGTDAQLAAAEVEIDDGTTPATPPLKITVPNLVRAPRTQLRLTGTQAVGTSGLWTKIDWDDAVIDDVSAWAGGSPSRITVPTGYTGARFTAGSYWASSGTGQRSLHVNKNGSSTFPNGIEGAVLGDHNASAGGSTTTGGQVAMPWLTVTPGDYYQVWAYQTSGGSLALQRYATWVEVEWRV